MGVRKSALNLNAWRANNVDVEEAKAKAEDARRKALIATTNRGLGMLTERAAATEVERAQQREEEEKTPQQLELERMEAQRAEDAKRAMASLDAVADAFSVRSFDTLDTQRDPDSWQGNYQTQVQTCSPATTCAVLARQLTHCRWQRLFRGKLKFHEAPITAIDLVLPFMLSGDAVGTLVRTPCWLCAVHDVDRGGWVHRACGTCWRGYLCDG